MFSVGAHFGYSRSRRHPTASPFIFGIKNRTEILDLEKTSELLAQAKEIMKAAGIEKKRLLLVGGKSEVKEIIAKAGERLSMPYVAGRWIGGTLTNFPEIKRRIDELKGLSEKREKGELGRFTKLERLMIDREISRLEERFGGLRLMNELPHMLLVVDPRHEHLAVAEAKVRRLPVLAIAGSDCDLDAVDHAVLGNDSLRASVQFFMDELVSAYEAGVKEAPAPVPASPAAA